LGQTETSPVTPDPGGLTEQAWADFAVELRGYVRRRVEPLWVEDVVSDVLLRLVQHRDGLEGARNPLAWMRRVAANAVTDHYRRRSVEKRALAQVEQEERGETAFGVEAAESAAPEIARCLLPFIRNLPEGYREALTLTEIEGLTHAEAAALLGLSISGVKSRVQRGRAKLKQALFRCCAIEVDRRGGIIDVAHRSQGCDAGC